MGNKKTAVYMVNNEMELMCTNIALGNENYNLEKERLRCRLEYLEKMEQEIVETPGDDKGFGIIKIL